MDLSAAAAAWADDAAEEPASAPAHTALITGLPVHLYDDVTPQGGKWDGPTDTRTRICYYCREPLHRNLSKGDAQCNACHKERYHAQLPRLGCARHCSYCFPMA